jgi:hypothetical protein
MTSKRTIDVIDATACAGKGCKKLGNIHMAIKYIKKTGVFCEKCSDELLRQGLAVKLEGNVNRKLVHEENGDANHFSLQNQNLQDSGNQSKIDPAQVRTTRRSSQL